MWAASEGDAEYVLLDWVSSIADRLPPVQTFRGELTGSLRSGGVRFML